jgi:cobaltochelatase CobN
MCVRIVYVGYTLRKSIIDALEWIRDNFDVNIDFKYYNVDEVDRGRISVEEYMYSLVDSDILLLDIRGGDNIYHITMDAIKKTKAKVIVSLVGGSSELIEITRLGKFSPGVFRRSRSGKSKPIDYGTIVRIRDMFERIGNIIPLGILRDARNYIYILKYYENPTFRNMVNMFMLLLKDYIGLDLNYHVEKPEELPSMGIYDIHTGKIYTDTMDYLREYKYSDKPLIGILFYGGHHFDQSVIAAEKIGLKLEERGYGIIPVFSGDLRYYLAIHKFLTSKNIDLKLLIDLLWFRFAGGPLGGDHKRTYAVLKLLNTPILHGIHLSITIDEWLKRNGISPIEIITTVILPELDGRIEPIVTHGRVRRSYEGFDIDEYRAVDDRIDKLTCRADKWAKLKMKKNSDKRIAVIIYAYPPGKENLGKTSYLDVFASLEKLVKALKNNGYNIPYTPSKDELKNMLLKTYIQTSSQDEINCDENICLDNETYSKLLKKLPARNKEEIYRFWGEPSEYVPIPGILLGNIFIGIQPSRGKHEDPSKIYHSRNIPPTHEYIGFYKWIEEIFGADAVIHLGTHGTLEFLPGKEVGLTSNCYPDILIGCMPNIYVYTIINPSEASIAKRRSYALIISHSTPPYMKYELPEEIRAIERRIRQYYDMKQYSEERAGELLKLIIRDAGKLGLGKSIDEIHDRIEEYKRTIMPKGLHILGYKPNKNELLNYLVFVSRYDRGEITSLYRLIAESENLNYEKILSGDKKYAKLYEYVELKARRLIENVLFDNISLDETLERLDMKNIDKRSISKVLDYLRGVMENVMISDELGSIIRALNGEYIMPSPGGDPVRNPEVYPTGRNMYQLDPTNIPTDTAWKRGEFIAEEIIRRYREKYGEYPRTVGVILWAFETMKTGGETIAAIFRLLGVRPKWKTGYIRELEVIPLEELGRPRIDVFINICGIFRDTFYNIVELIDKAFKLVSSLNEPPNKNYVIANNMHLKQRIRGETYHRIFGPPPDKYATELTTLIETGSWSNELELVNAYIQSMRYVYGENIHGVEREDLFKEIISNSQLVLQVRDTVEYEITDLDHYYEFLGGLSRTIQEIRGEKPLVLIADSTREHVKVEDINESIRRGVITRILNPRWIKEMLKHDYHGGEKIATRIENLLGLAATTHSVDNVLWDRIADKLVFDKETYDMIRENNPWAMRKVIEKLLEANRRGYWRTSNEVLNKLREKLDETNKYIEDLETTLTK